VVRDRHYRPVDRLFPGSLSAETTIADITVATWSGRSNREVDVQFLTEVCSWLEGTALATFIAGSWWAFPTIESLHVVAITLVVGSIAVADLRLLGLAWKSRPVTDVLHDVLPMTWIAFAVALTCGSLLFISQATKYIDNSALRIKMLLMLLAGINMLAFELITFRGVSKWDRDRPVPLTGQLAGAVSLACWLGILVFGRQIGWTMYPE
jgi:hypothetical protein